MFPLLGELAMRLVAPAQCAACDGALRRDAIFCAACAITVLPPASSHPRADAAAAWGGAIATAILRFKYLGRTDLARPLSHLLLPLAARLCRVDVVVPVPLHRERLRARGYNQAALLGRPVAARLGVPFVALGLQRVKATMPQASLDKCTRAANVAGAFLVHRPRDVAGRHVLVVDDVRTTGATLDACESVLRGAGAFGVHFLTVAQT